VSLKNVFRTPLVRWYRAHARDLPWRHPDTTPWQSLVSEIMLGQTPVVRVAPVYSEWIERWPTAADTANATPAQILRLWGRLGYPRRALRLREAAVAIERDHQGVVPNTEPELRALPGVGEYTAAAVLAFAYGQRIAVLDTNVRRVIARAVSGKAAAPATLTNTERDLARSLLPRSDAAAAEWSIAIMEFGALICTARNPDCSQCPISTQCAWRAAGYPEPTHVSARRQAWADTDRQCRGSVMAALRHSEKPVGRTDLTWHDAAQLERCLDSLLDDGLIDLTREGRYELPN